MAQLRRTKFHPNSPSSHFIVYLLASTNLQHIQMLFFPKKAMLCHEVIFGDFVFQRQVSAFRTRRTRLTHGSLNKLHTMAARFTFGRGWRPSVNKKRWQRKVHICLPANAPSVLFETARLPQFSELVGSDYVSIVPTGGTFWMKKPLLLREKLQNLHRWQNLSEHLFAATILSKISTLL